MTLKIFIDFIKYINHILTEKFPKEIASTILSSYLKNNVSFISIKDNNSKTILYKNEFNIASSISKNLETLINNNKIKYLDKIFYLNDHNIEYNNIYKINSGIIGWGINIL